MSQSSISPGFHFDHKKPFIYGGLSLVSQSSISPGFHFDWSGSIFTQVISWGSRNPVSLLVFISTRWLSAATQPCWMTVAIQYLSWFSFRPSIDAPWVNRSYKSRNPVSLLVFISTCSGNDEPKKPNNTSQSSISPGFHFDIPACFIYSGIRVNLSQSSISPGFHFDLFSDSTGGYHRVIWRSQSSISPGFHFDEQKDSLQKNNFTNMSQSSISPGFHFDLLIHLRRLTD